MMPIRPENQARYPKEWRSISLRIRARSGGQCECDGMCGLRHVVTGKGQLDLPPQLWIPQAPGVRCTAVNGEFHPVTKSKVVLTVAHLDHTPENCADENLKAWCQRCHNRYDAAERRKGIKERKRAGAAMADLLELGA